MFKKGYIPWNKGKSGYKTHGKKKGVCDNTGRTHFKKGDIPWNKGLSGWHSGKDHPLFGKPRSAEVREKIRKGNMGKKRTDDTKGKLRKSALSRKEEMRECGLKGLISQQNSKEPTSIEKKVYQTLKETGLLFETQKLINGKFLVDAYIPSLNLVIEIDGSYWHSLDRVMKKDKAENAYLKKCGYRVIRIPEARISGFSTASLLSEIIAEKEGVSNWQ